MSHLIKLAAIAALMCACMLTCSAQCEWAKPKAKKVRVKTTRPSRVASQATIPWQGNQPSLRTRRHARRKNRQ